MSFRTAMIGAALAGACATTHAVPASWSCGAMERAIAEDGAELQEAPDGNSKSLAQFHGEQPVCADPEVQGFGFRKVTLTDGRSGFVRASALSSP